MSLSRASAGHAWWSSQRVPRGETLSCRIGPLTLEIHHGDGEWQLAWSWVTEADAPWPATLTLRQGPIDEDACERYMVARPAERLRLTPLLCDRPVVIRPRQGVVLPSGESVTLYMSTPAMLRVEVGEPPVLLREIATLTLSDTWFGPSTREGELCYSGRTHARHLLTEVPQRAHRIVTPVHVRNEADTPLPLEKLSLPVPALSVYGSRDGSLWTQAVSLVRSSASDMAALKVDETPPRDAGPVELISGPREARAQGGLVRAFSMLFGQGA